MRDIKLLQKRGKDKREDCVEKLRNACNGTSVLEFHQGPLSFPLCDGADCLRYRRTTCWKGVANITRGRVPGKWSSDFHKR